MRVCAMKFGRCYNLDFSKMPKLGKGDRDGLVVRCTEFKKQGKLK